MTWLYDLEAKRMVRDATYRAKKYAGKIDPDAVRSRVAALKDIMVEQTTARATELAGLENDIKATILEPRNVPTIFIAQYLNVARELWSKSKRFSGPTLQTEAEAIAKKWVARGLAKDTVNAILVYFGLSPIP